MAANEKHGRTLFVRNIPYSATNEVLDKIFSDIGPIKSCFVVKDKESGNCRGFGYVKFTLLEDAEKAINTVKKIEGRNVHIVYANKKEKKKRFGQPQSVENKDVVTESTQERAQERSKDIKKKKKGQVVPIKGQKQAPNPLNEGKRARLIIRNLAFKCTKEELQKVFKKYGEVVDVHIPKKGSGTKLGFAFVQFKNKTQAGMAIKEVNGKDICGRVVAVDWALPKDKFESQLAAKTKVKEDEDAQSDQDERMEVEEDGDTDKKRNAQENAKNNSVDDSSSDDEESPEEDSDSEEEVEVDEDEKGSSQEDVDSDENIENDSQNENTQLSFEHKSDVGEGRTVFVRNLPFTVENEELEEFFSQFGAVKFVRVVVDKISGMSKGSAFVQFQSKEAADSCVETASKEEESGLSLGGRNMLINLAVSRQEAGQFSHKDKKKEQKDTRNLYLAREGMIRSGTATAKDVPPSDQAKRMKIDLAKRAKLKDQNVFVSSTRLCVHNIPPTVTDKTLRGILVKAAGTKEAKLVECRIMRDLNRLNSQGVGKSRGYAFCAFTQHEHALRALQNLNNNPDIFGDKKRPIVEFSLENRKALETKQKRLEKSKVRLMQKAPISQNSGTQKDNSVRTQKRKTHKNKCSYTPLENKKEQDSVARSLHKGPIGLPSHSGPKQRHKARSGQQEKEGKQAKFNKARNTNMTTRLQQSHKPQKIKPVKMKKSNKKRTDTDSFDKLVAAYKQKIMSSANF